MEPRLPPSPDPCVAPSPPSPSPAAPAVRGHDVVRRLGRGGGGDVWLLREHGTGRLVAGKVVRAAGHGGTARGPSTARRELRALRAATHPHVLTCHAAVPSGAEGTSTVVVSEYAAGGSLARLLSVRGRLGVGETVTAIGPIAQALAALHEQGIAHLDVSPGNILFTAQGKPLLADLGAAWLVGDPPAAPSGTPGFEDPSGPPEEQDAALRPAADVFGLGAVAWFCLAGAVPGRTAERPPLTMLRETVPPELATAIDAALADRPADRPTAAEFARAVFRSARPEPVDLAPAVDDDVLPELVTRIRPDERGKSRRRGRGAGRLPGRPSARLGLSSLRCAMLWRPLAARLATAASRWPSAPSREPAPRSLRAHRRSRASHRLPRHPSVARRSLARWGGIALLALAGCAVAWGAAAGGAPRSAAGAFAGATVQAPAAWSGLPDVLRRRAESADPVQAVQALAQIRARAITASDRELLERVSARGSEAATADSGLLDRLEREGTRLDGFSAEVLSAELLPQAAEAGGSTAVVRARVLSSGYATLTQAGRELSGPGAGRDQMLRIVLDRTEGAWRVVRILSA
ncbi:serine/threonine-protein kinase [Sinomonas albida]|uniref:serine/threonine-protein kinase n=1 Tax=Sinomonas albida TaxID=369942 RepID=UPI0010A89095|nr:serine/threonine-protein kinase [Sinomonas albida]